MDLKKKVILILLGVFGLYGIIDYGIQRIIVFPRFEELERTQAKENLERSIYAIQSEISHLDSLCHDWASWDDTYHFIEDQSDEYKESNLAFTTFEDLDINLLYMCSTNGKVVWGETYDLGTKEGIGLKDFSPDALSRDHPMLQFDIRDADLADVFLSGVINTEKGPMLVASRPILQSGNIGPIRGFLIMGRFLTEELIIKLREQTRVDFTVMEDVESLRSILEKTPLSIGKGFHYALEYRDKDRLDAFASYPDIRGKPAFIIKGTISRDTIKQGRTAMKYALFALVVLGIAVVFMILLIMERTILHPVTNLTKHVLSISRTGNFSVRLSVKRRDEIGALAREFDRMLEKIDDMNTVMEKINEQLIEDITKRQEIEVELHEANSQLQRLAAMDGLTQLSNRRRFDEYISTEWKRAVRDGTWLSLIIVDVDYFKLYNDTYGHQAGDDCLRAIAGVISSNTKRAPDFAARYGGEEFAVVLPSTDLKGAMHIAETIREHVYSLAIPHDKSSLDQRVTISAGVSCIVPKKDASQESLIRSADQALYDAKAQGRNRSRYSEQQ